MCHFAISGLVCVYVGGKFDFYTGFGRHRQLIFDFFGIVFRNLSGVFYHYLYWILPECGRVGVRKGWGENEEKESCVYHYFIPVIYAVFVYILWGTDRNIGGLCGWKGNGQLGGNFYTVLIFPCYSMKC